MQRQQQHILAEQKRLKHEKEAGDRKKAINKVIQQSKDRYLSEKTEKWRQIRRTEHEQEILQKDADQIAAKEAEELQKERPELQAKLNWQEKKVDYFERAKRLEEIPMLQASLKDRQLQDQNSIPARIRDRLGRMKVDHDEFLAKLKKERSMVYEEKLADFEKLSEEERKKRLEERRALRKEQRRANWLKEKTEEAEQRRKEEEEERQRQEEIARKEKEEQERKIKEHQEMLDRMAAIQKAKDEEIEKKLAEEKESLKEKPRDSWRSGVVDKEVKKEGDSSSCGNGGDNKPPSEESKKPEAWKPLFRDSPEDPTTSSWHEAADEKKDERRDDRRDRPSAFDRELDRDTRSRFSRDRKDGDRGDDRDRHEDRERRDDRDRREERVEDRDRREDSGSSWCRVRKTDDDSAHRPVINRGGGGGGGAGVGVPDGAWRSGKDDERKDEPVRRAPDERRAAQTPREKSAREQPQKQEGDDGWSQVSRRR